MFNLAEMWGLRPDGSNPCLHVKRFKEEKRERFLSAEEFRRLGKVLNEILEDGSETLSAVAAIRLLMLTGCRLSEIQKLRWEHVHLDARELRPRDSKTGAKVVHVGDPAIAVLREIDRQDNSPWVIAGRKPGSHLTDLQHPWRSIRARAGLEDVRIHNLRHSYASTALQHGSPAWRDRPDHRPAARSRPSRDHPEIHAFGRRDGARGGRSRWRGSGGLSHGQGEKDAPDRCRRCQAQARRERIHGLGYARSRHSP